MPSCREMSELATDYMEGALTWRQWLAARRHLLLCSMCRAYYDQLAKLTKLLRGGTLPGPDAATEQALLATQRPGNPAP
jgi:predicted anti-sigma-YlaC factor YlaD